MLCYPGRLEAVFKSVLLTISGTAPVSLTELKTHLKVDGSDENALIQIYLDAAIEQAANYTRRILVGGEYKAITNFFYYTLEFDVSPIDVSSIVVKYYDVNNAEQTLASSEYTVKVFGDDEPVQIVFDGTLPSLYDRYDAVQVEFDAGYTTVPSQIKQAIMLQAASYYENRQSEVVGNVSHVINMGFHQMLFPFKML